MPSEESTGEGELAAGFLAAVGVRIRELRMVRRLTVQDLADRSGISRRLLTQIEHGQANPSLVTVTRIARQLGTDFTVLLEGTSPEAATTVLGPDAHTLIWSTDRGSSAHLLIATAGTRAADLWRWRLAPGERYLGRPDPAGSQELFHVLDGTLTIVSDGVESIIEAGSSARLLSDREYEYRNATGSFVSFIRVVSLAR